MAYGPYGFRNMSALNSPDNLLDEFKSTHCPPPGSGDNCGTCQLNLYSPGRKGYRRFSAELRAESYVVCTCCRKMSHKACCCGEKSLLEGAILGGSGVGNISGFICPPCTNTFLRQCIERRSPISSYPSGYIFSDAPYAFAAPSRAFPSTDDLLGMAALLPDSSAQRLGFNRPLSAESLTQEFVHAMKEEWDKLQLDDLSIIQRNPAARGLNSPGGELNAAAEAGTSSSMPSTAAI